MVGLVFWFQDFDKDVFSSRPTIDLDAWRYAAKVGRVNQLKCINTSVISIDGGMNFEIIGTSENDFSNWMKSNATKNTLIFDTEWTCPNTAISLSQVSHINVDWYVFGEASGFVNTGIDFPGQFVYLPQNGMAACHAVHVATAVMFDRWVEIS